MSKEKDEFEESFGDSGFGDQDSDFNFDDEDEFDVDEGDVELSAFPGSSDDNESFNSGVSDDEFEMEDNSELEGDYEEDSIEFEDEDEFDHEEDSIEFEDEEDSPKEKRKLFGKKSSDGEELDGSNKSNIIKYAFYAGSVAVIGAIGYVGVSMFAPNLLGGNDDYYTPPAPVSAPVNVANNIAQSGQGLPQNNTPPLPKPGVTPNIAQPGQVPGVLDNPRPGLQGGEQVVPQANLNLGFPQDTPPKIDEPVTTSKEFDNLRVTVEDIGVAIGAILNKVDSLDRVFVTKEELTSVIGQEVSKQVKSSMPEVDMSQTASKNDLQTISEKMSTDIITLQNAFRDALSELSNKEAEAEKSRELLISAEEKMVELESRFNAFASEISDLETVIEAQKGEISSLEKVIESQKTEIAATKRTVSNVSKVQKEQIDSRNAIGGGIEPPLKPRVLSNYRLAGVAKDMAWIETESGVSRIRIGQSIPGVGIIEGIRPVNGNWAVVTPVGLIMP